MAKVIQGLLATIASYEPADNSISAYGQAMGYIPYITWSY